MATQHHPLRPRTLVVGVLAGLAFAVISSAGIAAERLSRGSAEVTAAATAIASSAAVVVLAIALRPFWRKEWGGDPELPAFATLASQALGAGLGVLVVHTLLRAGPFQGCVWLCERPAQLVNDFAAVFGALALVWGGTRRGLGLAANLVAFGIAVAYAWTGSRWHLDNWGTGSRLPVQMAVLVQLAATAIGVEVFCRRARLGAPGSLDDADEA